MKKAKKLVPASRITISLAHVRELLKFLAENKIRNFTLSVVNSSAYLFAECKGKSIHMYVTGCNPYMDSDYKAKFKEVYHESKLLAFLGKETLLECVEREAAFISYVFKKADPCVEYSLSAAPEYLITSCCKVNASREDRAAALTLAFSYSY